MTDSAPQTSVWKLVDRLRNEVPTDDLPVVLSLLIYLRWADFLEAEQEATAAFEDTAFEPILSSSLHWRTWHQLPTADLQAFLRERLAPALEQLGNHHHHALAINLHRVGQAFKPLLQLSELSLIALVRWLEEQPFETPSDRRRLLDTFDAIIEKFADARIGEYRTPAQIARLMASLGRPFNGDRVYDPTLGTANVLTNVYDLVYKQNIERSLVPKAATNINVVGLELNLSAYIIGLTRLALVGVDDPHIDLGNSLERLPSAHLGGYDLIFSHPPFGARVNQDIPDHFPVRSRDATSLFIQHSLTNLRGKGRAIIIVPCSLLSNRSETDLRQWLLKRCQVKAIIDLPENAFAPLTKIRGCLMVLDKNGPTNRVRMVDAQPYFDEAHGQQPAHIGDKGLLALVHAVYSPSTGKNSWDVNSDSIQGPEWDLSPHRRERSELTRVLDELSTQVETHRLDDICEIMAGRSISSADLVDRPLGENPVPYIRIKDVQRGKASRSSSWLSAKAVDSVKPEWKLRAGDILLSKSGTIGKAGIVQNGALGAIAASGNYIIRTDRDQIDPLFLLAYLDSNACRSWLNERASGSVISHLSIRVISELPVPVPPLPIQQRVASQYRDHKVDAFLYLTKLLSRTESDPVADSIDQWIIKSLKILTGLKGQKLALEKIVELVEQFASNSLPIRFCGDCGKPYWLLETDYGFYRAGSAIADDTHCQVCLLVGNDSESKHSPRFPGGGPLVLWAATLDEFMRKLVGLTSLPKGLALLHVLRVALDGLSKSEKRIVGHLPIEENARQITIAIKRLLSTIVDTLVDDINLEFTPTTNELIRGKAQTLTVRVTNKSTLPLHNLHLSADTNWGLEFSFLDSLNEPATQYTDQEDQEIAPVPDWHDAKLTYLAEQASENLLLQGTVPYKAKDSITVLLRWTAKNVEGRTVSGTRQIIILVKNADTPSSRLTNDTLGGSPYVCGDPVRPERNDVFFGRDELIEQIRRQILKSGNVVLLEGNRRAGKTSILRHLEGTSAITGWLGVYCSLQGAEGSQDGVGVPTVEVFREVAKSLARAVHGCGLETPLPDGSVLSPGSRPLGIAKACRSGIGQEAAFADFREYAEILLELLQKNKLGALLMLDEFDKLQEGIDNGITSPQVPENIRFLVQTHSGFSAILTGSRRLKRLREEYWSALFGLGTRLGVSSLSRDAARRLVTEPVQRRISYSDEAIERAIDLTASQPYLLQCLCNRIFDRIARGTNRTVTIDTVDAAGKDLVQDNEHFASLWAYAATHRRRFLLAICNLDTKDRDPLRLGELSELLSSHGIEILDDTLIADLDFLRDLELVDLDEGRYRLTIPLMGHWIKAQQDFDALRKQALYETEDEHA